MKLSPKYSLLFIFLLFCFARTSAQQDIIRLRQLLTAEKTDTGKINLLNKLSSALIKDSKFDSALLHADAAFKLCERLRPAVITYPLDSMLVREYSNAAHNAGYVHYVKNSYPAALDCWMKALKADEILNNKKGMARRLCNIGNVYSDQGNYPKALEHYLRSLKCAEEINDKARISTALGNIGIVYYDQGNYDKALDHYFRALQTAEQLGDPNEISRHVGNIAIVYKEKKEYDKALQHFTRALKLAEESSNKLATSAWLGNIGNVFKEQKLYEKALEHYLKALNLNKEMEDNIRAATVMGSIGTLYIDAADLPAPPGEEGKYKQHGRGLKWKIAFDYLYSALQLSVSAGTMDYLKERYEQLSTLYERSEIPLPDSVGGKMLNGEQMRLRSLYYYKRSIAISNIIFSEENKNQLLQKELSYEFEKKEAAAQALHEKEIAVAEAEKKKQRLTIWSISFSLVIVILFSGLILRALRTTRKQKRIIEMQKQMVEKQKEYVEVKQKEILDSIHYAQRIQSALITSQNYIHRNLSRLLRN